MRNRILHVFGEFSISVDERGVVSMDMFASTPLNTTVYLSTSIQAHTVAFSLVNVFEVFY